MLWPLTQKQKNNTGQLKNYIMAESQLNHSHKNMNIVDGYLYLFRTDCFMEPYFRCAEQEVSSKAHELKADIS